ncbi:hypothetical protein NST69_15525 [Paenibacillus sp. FSL P2-0089]|uniref:hypothetical protein n=1 Tax=Paenibacillus sp. FSL P2-0089 TaxID=2954526 RepID=UPI00315A2AC9
MEKQQLITSLTILLNRGIDSGQTTLFNGQKHDDLVKELRDYLDANRKFLGGNIHLEITQAMNDHGVDLILTIEGFCKIGFQVKSHYDVSEQEFQSKVKRQLAESFFHALDKYYILICSPIQDKTNNYTMKISHLINELSSLKTNYHCVFGPDHTAALFTNLNTLDETQFNLEYQRFAYERDNIEELKQMLSETLNKKDYETAEGYLARRKEYSYAEPQTAAQMNTILQWDLSADDLHETKESIVRYISELRNLTQNSREILTGILERSKPSARALNEDRVALVREVESHLRMNSRALFEEYTVLEQAGFVYHDKEDNRDYYYVTSKGAGWPLVSSLVKYCEIKGIPLETLFSKMDFSVLD